MTSLKIVRDGEEHVEFYLDGKFLTHVDHDNHGWIGMETVEEALLECANRLKWKVEEICEDSDEIDDC